MLLERQAVAGDRLYAKLTSSHIPGLDGIRAMAVSAVILGHLPNTHGPAAQGVSTFFVLSGFLITWLLFEEKQRTGTISIRLFYIRRALRLLPAFYVFWIIYVVLAVAVQHRAEWGQYLAAAFYASNYYQIIMRPQHAAMAHTWSLAVEEQFYILWPCAFLFLSRSLRNLACFLTATILFVWVYRVVLFRMGAPAFRIELGFDSRADQLAIGCLLAVLLRSARVRTFVQRTAGYTLSLAAIALAIVSIALTEHFGPSYTCQIGYAADGVLAGVVITQAITRSELWLWSWLETRPLLYVGGISYSIYLYHWIGNKAVMTYAERYGKVAETVTAFALAIGAASISYYVVERPFLRLKKRFTPRRETAVPVPAVQGGD